MEVDFMSEKEHDVWQNKPDRRRWWPYALVIVLGLSFGIWQTMGRERTNEEEMNQQNSDLIGTEQRDDNLLQNDQQIEMPENRDGKENTVLPNEQQPVLNQQQEEKTTREQENRTEEKQPEQPANVGVAAKTPSLLIPASGKWDRLYGYGYDDTLKDYRFHDGVDMPLSLGELVFCALDGEISQITEDDYYGQSVTITHDEHIVTKYYGIESDLAEGVSLKAGEVVGQIVASPLFETEQIPHLHFEVWIDGKRVDPLLYLK